MLLNLAMFKVDFDGVGVAVKGVDGTKAWEVPKTVAAAMVRSDLVFILMVVRLLERLKEFKK